MFEGGILIGFLKSIQLVMGAYNGWWSNSFFAEEDENPGKNIPKSLFTGGIFSDGNLCNSEPGLYVCASHQCTGRIHL